MDKRSQNPCRIMKAQILANELENHMQSWMLKHICKKEAMPFKQLVSRHLLACEAYCKYFAIL